MCKRIMALVLLAAVLLCAVPAGAAVTRFAVLLDSTDPENDAMDAVRAYVLYASWQCDFLDAWSHPDLEGYDAVIICLKDEQELPEDVTRQLRLLDAPLFVIGGGGIKQVARSAVYRQGDVMLRLETHTGASNDLLLTIPGLWLMPLSGSTALGGSVYVDGAETPLCQRRGHVTHFAYFDGDQPLLSAMLADQLQLWQWPYEGKPTAYGHYLVLENAYPFMDPDALLERTELLREEGMPYVIAVTGIYANGDHPSMKRFCEALRYEQSLGTGIILRSPFVSISQVGLDSLMTHLDIAYDAYATYGVYPLGIMAPKAWLQCEKGLDAVRGFRTVFLFNSDEDVAEAMTENAAYHDGHHIIAPAWEEENAVSSSYAQAIYLDALMDIEEMRTLIQRLKKSSRAFKGFGEMESAVYIGDHAVTYVDGNLYANGVKQDTSYTPFTYDEHFEFDRGFAQYMKDQIESSNDVLKVFVVCACTLFIFFMYLFRKQVRRELLLGKKEKKHKRK